MASLVTRLSEEHGVLSLPEGDQPLAVGDRVEVGLAADAVGAEIGALAHRLLSKRSETQI